MTDLAQLADARKLDALIFRQAFAPKGMKRKRAAETRSHVHAMLARECPKPSAKGRRRRTR